jgi:hypothetical protein
MSTSAMAVMLKWFSAALDITAGVIIEMTIFSSACSGKSLIAYLTEKLC